MLSSRILEGMWATNQTTLIFTFNETTDNNPRAVCFV